MSDIPPPVTACLDPAAKALAEATGPHPRRRSRRGDRRLGGRLHVGRAQYSAPARRTEVHASPLRAGLDVDVACVRVTGTVHDFLMPDSPRDTRAADVARHLAIDALHTALQDD
ncbi:hypothetical protein GCM10010377_43210 [Streptomyces viridiviolaceus]|nr:hypothetical protein GCM10010377_43210 [Streptomyces viridiviolaceus]